MSQPIPQAKAPAGRNGLLYHLNAPNNNLLTYFEEISQQGDIVQLGFLPAYLVNHPDYVQDVLVKHSKSFHKPNSVKYAVDQFFNGQNLFSSDDEAWRVLRKAVQPAFHMRRIGGYLDMIADTTQDHMQLWSVGQTVDFPKLMMNLTMSVTSMSLFSKDVANDDVGQAIIDFLNHFSNRITNPIPIPSWLPLQSNREMKQSLQTIDNLLVPIIESRKASGEDTGDILSMLLNAQRQDENGILTDHQIRNEILNLFAAGYEVTANTTAFTIYLISQHPEVYQRLITEIDSVLGNDVITLENLNELTYLQQTIDESMRLLPVTAVVSRTAIEDVTIGDYHIPKNAQVFVAPWVLHRRDDIFPNPETFNPDRFAPDAKDNIPKHGYIPFSTGPRICLGNAFAMLQMRTTIASMLREFRFDLADDYIFEPFWRFNTQLRHGLPLTLHRRDEQ